MSKYFGEESFADELLRRLKEFKKPEVKKCGSVCIVLSAVFLFLLFAAIIVCAVKIYLKHRDEYEGFKQHYCDACEDDEAEEAEEEDSDNG